MLRLVIAATCLVLALASPAMADARTDAALRLSQGAVGDRVPDLAFDDATGKRITVADLRGKPLLVTLIYTSCSNACPLVIESLALAATAAEDALGKGSFNILTVGFDTRADTPERMRAFARAHNVGADNWYFVGSDRETVERLASAVGFSYFSSAGGFDHMAQVTVLDKTGTIYQQIYGSTFEPPAIVEPLKQLLLGGERSIFSLAGIGDRVKLFCTVYNPITGRYYFNTALLVSIVVGAGCLLGVLVFLVRETRKSLRSGRV
jgi:protein SCO1